MSTPESIAEAFGRGLMQGMIGGNVTPAAAQAPMVIPMDSVRQAVREVLDPLIADEDAAPTPQQLDMNFIDVEREPIDPIAELTLQRVAEAQARAAAREEAVGRESERQHAYDPDSPTSRTPWMTPGPADGTLVFPPVPPK